MMANALCDCKWIVVEMLSILNGNVHRRRHSKAESRTPTTATSIKRNAQREWTVEGSKKKKSVEDKLALKWCNRSISIRSLFARTRLERCQLYVSCPIRSKEALNLQPSSCASFRRVVVNKAEPWAISFNGNRQFGLCAYFFLLRRPIRYFFSLVWHLQF